MKTTLCLIAIFALSFMCKPIMAQDTIQQIKHPPIREQLSDSLINLDIPKGKYSLSDFNVSIYRDKDINQECMEKMAMNLMNPWCKNYMLMHISGKDSIIINSTGRLQEFFAPVRNSKEALMYVKIATGYTTQNDFLWVIGRIEAKREDRENFKKMEQEELEKYEETKDRQALEMFYKWYDHSYWTCRLPEIEDSYIKKVDDGWEMLLYKDELDVNHYSGNNSYIMQLKVLVTPNGEIKTLSTKTAFHYKYDPQLQMD